VDALVEEDADGGGTGFFLAGAITCFSVVCFPVLQLHYKEISNQ